MCQEGPNNFFAQVVGLPEKQHQAGQNSPKYLKLQNHRYQQRYENKYEKANLVDQKDLGSYLDLMLLL